MPEAKKPRYDEQSETLAEQYRRVMTEFNDVQEKLQKVEFLWF